MAYDYLLLEYEWKAGEYSQRKAKVDNMAVPLRLAMIYERYAYTSEPVTERMWFDEEGIPHFHVITKITPGLEVPAIEEKGT